MTSEIKVDTISEQTSANGVTIDGLTIKDGNIIGDVALAGTTPTFTIGDAGAEDAALIFDGNALDYYIALDDSADNLIIGSGSTVGSNSLITIDSDGDFTLDSAGDIILDADGGDIRFKDGGTEIGVFENSSSDLQIKASIQDKDIIFRGNDGGAGINALVLDMSAAGAATFNAGFTAQAASTITTADNTDTLTLTSTDADADEGPILKLHRDSGSPADGDIIGEIRFNADNDAGEDTECLHFKAQLADASDGSEDGQIYLIAKKDGTDRNRFAVKSDETIFNEDSVDVDFRVESNGATHMLFVDGGNDVVIVGGKDGSGTVPVPTNTAGGLDPVFQLQGANNANQYSMHISAGIASAGSPPRLIMSKSRDATLNGNTILQDDDAIGAITFAGADGTDRNSVAAEIIANVDGTPGGNDMPGRLIFLTTADGSNSTSERMRINQAGQVFIGATGSIGAVHESGNDEQLGVANTGNDQTVYFNATNASYTTYVQRNDAVRAANSAFGLFIASTGNESDNQFRLMGDGTTFQDGAASTSGADYAEYFEWKDGNSSSEDRRGYSVVLDGDKIVKATDSDDVSKIIGIISAFPAVVGDSASDKWQLKHLKDNFGSYVYEDYTQTEWTIVEEDKDDIFHSYQTDLIPDDVTVPDDAVVITKDADGNNLQRMKVNPDWNKDTTYIPRSDRKEWDTVGLMGKLRLKKGQPTGTNWLKMRDISSDVEEWLVR